MKKILCCIALCSMFVAIGCNFKPNKKELISRKWKFKELDEKDLKAMSTRAMAFVQPMIDTISDPKVKDAKQKAFETMIESRSMMMKGMLKNMRIEYKADGTYEAFRPSAEASDTIGEKETGLWSLSDDEKTLIETPHKGVEETREEIISVTEELLTVRIRSKNGELDLHFTLEAY